MNEQRKAVARKNAALARAAKAAKQLPIEERFWSKVDKRGPDECWPWTAAVRRKDEGYGAFCYEGRNQPAQRFAWQFANKACIMPGYVACHACDNPICCNPKHIWIGTRLENDKDRVTKGRACRGEKQRLAKFSVDAVAAFRLMYKTGWYGPADVSNRFGVHYKTAKQMLTGVNWKHVTIEDERRVAREARERWAKLREQWSAAK